MRFMGKRPTVAEAKYWQRIISALDRTNGDNRYRLPKEDFHAYLADASELAAIDHQCFEMFMAEFDATLSRFTATVLELTKRANDP